VDLIEYVKLFVGYCGVWGFSRFSCGAVH